MKFEKTEIEGAFVIKLDLHADERGHFARCFCKKEFESVGITCNFPQSNISFNRRTGTLRGMHYQKGPHSEPKLIRCSRGRIFDVLVDIRSNSPTFRKWIGIELSQDSYSMLFAPAGLAHGFVTLEDNTELFYQMGAFYCPESAAGFKWNDPAFKIKWPIDSPILSPSDAGYPNWVELEND